MRSGKACERRKQAADLARVGLVAEHRQAEGRLGDEQVAAHQLERRRRGIGPPLVVAGDDGAAPACSITTWALPRMCPAGTSRTVTPPMRNGLAVAQRLEAAGAVSRRAAPS